MKENIKRFKICIFGDGGVGKTTLVKRYLQGIFDDATPMTIGVEFYVKKLKIDEHPCSLQIWDFAGENEFRDLFPSFVRDASGGIFMYDITRRSSLEDFEDWMYVFQEQNKEQIGVPLILVGGKSDLEEERLIQEQDILEATQRFGQFDHLECSSKTGQNIEKIFEILTRKILENKKLI